MNTTPTISWHSINPKVSMRSADRYVTPNWDHFLEEGPLTNERIEHYARLGRYGTEKQLAAMDRFQSLVLRQNQTAEKARQAKRDEKSLNKYIESLIS